MRIARRRFLSALGVGAAAAGGSLPLGALSNVLEPSRTRQAGGPARLDSNENAYGPSPAVTSAIQAALSEVNRYPFHEFERLMKQISDLHQVAPEQVLIGCGSTEVLRAAAAAFLGPGKKLVQASPTFELLAMFAKSIGAEVLSLPLTAGFAHDVDAMAARFDKSVGLVYICNPNNPTGSLTPRQDIERLISHLPAEAHILIDEAYHHFVGDSPLYASFIEHPVKDDRVIVTRTFSKIYGLAGLRLGYGVATQPAIDRIGDFTVAGNENIVVLAAAQAALRDVAGVRDFYLRNLKEKQAFVREAGKRGRKVIPSYANFVMMETGRPAKTVIAHCRQNGVLIGRPFPPMDNYVRVSLGTEDEMVRFWQAWDRLPS
jgi:histidinol-phosphate aminotransferase